jgi:hypothetical protein
MQYSFCWQASAFCHQPLYFEEVNLERYGYAHNKYIQPWFSAAHFFCTIPALPYLMTAEPPGECIYTAGHYRPGSPYEPERVLPPWSTAGALMEATVAVGLVFAIP